MGRKEGAVAFAVMAGGMFLVSTMGPVFAYAFQPGAMGALQLCAFAVLGLGLSASLYGISTILNSLAPVPAAPQAGAVSSPVAPDPRADLMGDPSKSGSRTYSSPQELMSSVRTLIELENWKLAHQRAFELVEAYPESEEAAKVKKNLEYLQKKASA